jgi:predicted membrane metal-binding protein
MKDKPSLWDRWWLSGFSKKALAFFFSLTLFLFFLYILGNFQEFLESTQLMILSWMRSISYMTTLAVILFILAEIFQKKDPPLSVLANVTGSLIIGFFTTFLYLAVSLLFALVQNPPSGTGTASP